VQSKALCFIILLLLVSFLLSSQADKGFSSSGPFGKETEAYPQATKKPKEDYLSTFLSRDTKPLGLKENSTLQQFLNQRYITWVIRSEMRQILR